MTNKPNDVRVSRELLEQLRNVCGDPDLWHQATVALAQPDDQHAPFPGYPTVPDDRKLPADQQGKPIQLSEDVREYLREGIENSTGCEDSDVDYDFAEELAMLLGPIYRHAQPATAKVDERAEFELWAEQHFASADYSCNHAGVYLRDWMRHSLAAWQARAKLNGGQS